MRLRLPIFVISSVILLVFALNLFIHFNEFKKLTLQVSAASDLTIYDDNLASGFTDWSWGGSRNFQATEQKQNGSSSISFEPTAWSGLYLHTDNLIETNQYESIKFSIFAPTDGQKLSVMLYDANNQMIGSPRPLSDFNGDPTANTWKTYTIPLKDLNPSLLPIKGFGLQEASGQNQPKIFIDDISLIAKNVPEPTATPVPSTSMQPANTTSGNALYLYNDELSGEWENWSWGSSIKFDSSSPVFAGQKAITFKTDASWGAFYLHAKSPLDTTPYSTLNLVLQADQADRKYVIELRDANNKSLGAVQLKTLGGNPPTTWKTYSIPLSNLNASSKKISGIIIQDQSGTAHGTLSIDDVSFGGSKNTSSSAVAGASATNTDQTTNSGTNPLKGAKLYVKPDNAAKRTADEWRAAGRSAEADHMTKIANSPTALWVVDGDPTVLVQDHVTRAQSDGSVPVIVAYNIPGRDCGQYSAGGSTADGYKEWITKMAQAIGDRKAAVILEPDALGMDCLQNDTTYSLLRHAVETLEARANTAVYINVSTWVDGDAMAQRLQKSGIDKAQGFALNTSGYDATDSMIAYGNSLSNKIGGKHYVIDTSRNGNGPYDASQPEPWCNPPDRALGPKPTTQTGNEKIDAYLWIKVPGESDGTCRGGPGAGQWWPEYALGLAQRASY